MMTAVACDHWMPEEQTIAKAQSSRCTREILMWCRREGDSRRSIEAGRHEAYVHAARRLHCIEQIFHRSLQLLERCGAVRGDQRLHTVVGLCDRFGNLRYQDTSHTHNDVLQRWTHELDESRHRNI